MCDIAIILHGNISVATMLTMPHGGY